MSVSDAVAPALSVAVTVMTLLPVCSAIDAIDHDVVPVAVPLPPRSFAHATELTLVSSDAVPDSASVAVFVLNVAAVVGEVIEIAGGGFAGGVVLEAVQVTVADPEQPHTNGMGVKVSASVPEALVDDAKVPLTTVRGQMPPRSAVNAFADPIGMLVVVAVDVPQLLVVNDIVVIIVPAEFTVNVMGFDWLVVPAQSPVMAANAPTPTAYMDTTNSGKRMSLRMSEGVSFGPLHSLANSERASDITRHAGRCRQMPE